MSKQALDALGVAITNAGYTWTPEMRNAYEKGIRESKWVGLTEEEKDGFWKADQMSGEEWDELFAEVEAKLKEKNGG